MQTNFSQPLLRCCRRCRSRGALPGGGPAPPNTGGFFKAFGVFLAAGWGEQHSEGGCTGCGPSVSSGLARPQKHGQCGAAAGVLGGCEPPGSLRPRAPWQLAFMVCPGKYKLVFQRGSAQGLVSVLGMTSVRHILF